MADSFMLKAILSAVDKISPTLKTVRGGINATHKSFRDLGSASRGLVGSFGLPTAISFGAIGWGALNAARSAMQYSASVQDAVDVTGVQAEQLQRLQGAFRLGGLEAEAANDAIVKFNKGIADAAAGKDKGFAELMTRLRIPLRNAKGEIRSITEILPEFAAGLEANENHALRTRMAMEAFGKTGAKLLPTLTGGKDALIEMLSAQQTMGKVLSADSVERLDKLDETLGEIGAQYRTQTAEMFAFAAPAIMPALKALESWIAANQVLLQQKVGGYITRLATAFQGWVDSGGFERLGNGIVRVVDGISDFVDAMGGMRNVLIGIGALILAGPLSSAVQLVMVFARMATYVAPLLIGALSMVGTAIIAVGRAMLANPILAIVAAIATAAYLIYDNWGGISTWFSALWASVRSNLVAAWSAISAWLAELWNSVSATLTGFLGFVADALMSFHPLGIIVRNWEPIVTWFSSLWDRVKGFIEPIMNGARAVGGFVGKVFGSGDSTPVAQGASALARQPASPNPAAASMGSPLANRGALTGPQQPARLNGELRVRFEGAPEGMRVDPGRTNQPGLAVNPDVGYRSALSF
ncbi:hypothetical protein CURE108131_23195 [Cupriavidus respiraculi]|uniref:Phage tail tape measure protein n=2 Tax=Cupriavidus respiraculi TaxID=195930 RepID=A0ABM8WXW6_9BURK|nr:hypothetical protein LMG21510_01957 [Cupriavidus respiraculi]